LASQHADLDVFAGVRLALPVVVLDHLDLGRRLFLRRLGLDLSLLRLGFGLLLDLFQQIGLLSRLRKRRRGFLAAGVEVFGFLGGKRINIAHCLCLSWLRKRGGCLPPPRTIHAIFTRPFTANSSSATRRRKRPTSDWSLSAIIALRASSYLARTRSSSWFFRLSVLPGSLRPPGASPKSAAVSSSVGLDGTFSRSRTSSAVVPWRWPGSGAVGPSKRRG